MTLYIFPGRIGMILSVIGFFCIVPTIIHLIVSDKKRKIKFKRIDTVSSILCIIFYICYSIHYGVLSIYGILYNNTSQFKTATCISFWFVPFWMSLARLFSTIFFIARLYKTFHGSAFAISQRMLQIAIIILILLHLIITTCFVYQLIIPMIKITQNPTSSLIVSIHSYQQCSFLLDVLSEHRKIWMFIGVTMSGITDIIVGIGLLRLYVKKVVLLSIACNEINSVIQLQSKHVDKRNRRRLKKNALFLSLAEKTTMIVILMTFSNFLGLMINGIRIGQHWMMLDNIIRSWCIYMTYKCGKKLYNIICFKSTFCFNCCKNCCFCCCCKVDTLPIHLKLAINVMNTSNTNTNTAEHTMPTTPEIMNNISAISVSVTDIATNVTPIPKVIQFKIKESVKIPTLKTENVMDDDSLFLDSNEYSNSRHVSPSNSFVKSNQIEKEITTNIELETKISDFNVEIQENEDEIP